MKTLRIMVLGFLVIAFISCSSKKSISTQLPYEIESVYFQKWTDSNEQSGTGVDFHIQFKNPLPQNTTLAKLYFQNQEGFFDLDDDLNYIVRFFNKTQDLIMDGETANEYGNKAPEITKPRFSLQPNEAILEFHNGNEIQHYKIIDLKEKEVRTIPSSNPGN